MISRVFPHVVFTCGANVVSHHVNTEQIETIKSRRFRRRLARIKKTRDAASFVSFDRVESIPQEERNLAGEKLKPKHTEHPPPSFGSPPRRGETRLQTCENKITSNFRSNWSELGGEGGRTRARETRESRGTGDSGPLRNHRMPVYPWRFSRRLLPWKRLPPPCSTSSLSAAYQ